MEMLITVYASIYIVYFVFNRPISGSFLLRPVRSRLLNYEWKILWKDAVVSWIEVLLGIYLVALLVFGYLAPMIEK